MPKYQLAEKPVFQMAAGIIKRHHQDLHAIGVKIDILFAFALEDSEGNKKTPTLSHQGYPANGIAKILNLKDRLCRGYDAEIILDGDAWAGLTDNQKLAILDHEITHFVVKRNSDGNVIRDYMERPRLMMKKHERQFGWFDSIAARYGRDSAEVQQATHVFDTGGQVYFGFLDDLAAHAALTTLTPPEEEEYEEEALS